MEPDIRRMRSADAEAVAGLCGQLGYPSTRDEIAHRWARLAGDPAHAVFVAVGDGRPMGWIHVAVRPLLEFDLSAEICGLVVDEASRGAGIGRLLLNAAERWALENGCGAVRVRSRIARARAHAFYERHGYVKSKTQHVFEKPLGPG
jgi:GNAT superfamily N-acetyltransferase